VGTVISFANTKGGVGKSTLAVHLALWLADSGSSVAVIDADDQATAATWLSRICNHAVTVETLNEASEDGRADELRVKINALSSQHDFVVIDTKGSAALSTSAAIIKSDLTFVPLQASATEIWPIENALGVIRLSKEARGGKPDAKLIFNLTDDRDVVAKETRTLAKKHDIYVARTNVKRLRAYRDAPANATVTTRLTDERGKLAGQRLVQLFEEVLADYLPETNRRAANE
jgi:chromosome partitioning protein